MTCGFTTYVVLCAIININNLQNKLIHKETTVCKGSANHSSKHSMVDIILYSFYLNWAYVEQELCTLCLMRQEEKYWSVMLKPNY